MALSWSVTLKTYARVRMSRCSAPVMAVLARRRTSRSGSCRRVVRVLAVQEIREDLGPDRLLLIGLELGHHGGELGRRKGRDLALVLRLERLRQLESPGHQRFDGGVRWRGEEVGQIPAN